MLELGGRLHARAGAARCAFCRQEFGGWAGRACPGCGVLLHRACTRELEGRCPTLGCPEPPPAAPIPRRALGLGLLAAGVAVLVGAVLVPAEPPAAGLFAGRPRSAPGSLSAEAIPPGGGARRPAPPPSAPAPTSSDAPAPEPGAVRNQPPGAPPVRGGGATPPGPAAGSRGGEAPRGSVPQPPLHRRGPPDAGPLEVVPGMGVVLRRVRLVADEQPTWLELGGGSLGQLAGKVWRVERDELQRGVIGRLGDPTGGRTADELVRVPAGDFRCWRWADAAETPQGWWSETRWWARGLPVVVRSVRRSGGRGQPDVRDEVELVALEPP